MAPQRKASEEGADSPAKRMKLGPILRTEFARVVPPASASTLKIVSINVAGLRSVLDEDRPADKRAALASLVASESPDVLCLNEHKLKKQDVKASVEKLKALLPGYSRAAFSCSGPPAKKGYSGVAILIKDGGAVPKDAEIVEGMPEVERASKDSIIAHEGRLLTLKLPDHKLCVISTYAPNSGQDLRRLGYRTEDKGWDQTMAEYVMALKNVWGTEVAVIGDLNCCIRAHDIHNMYTRPNFSELCDGSIPIEDQYTGLSSIKKTPGITIEERRSFGKMLHEAGLVDSFRSQHPDATGIFSYYSQRIAANRDANKGLRLDYVLVTSGLLSDEAQTKLIDSFILSDHDTPQLADHTPVGATFLLR